MSYTLRSHIGGLGAVRHPFDDDELIPVEDNEIVVDDGELAHAIARESGSLDLVETPDNSEPSDSDTDTEGPPVDPSELSVSDLHDWAATTSDTDAISDVIGVERDSKDRSSAIERLEQRQNAIEDED